MRERNEYQRRIWFLYASMETASVIGFERVNWKHNYNTRHSYEGNYVLPKIRTRTGKKSIVYWVPKIWLLQIFWILQMWISWKLCSVLCFCLYWFGQGYSERVRFGYLTAWDWVVGDGMTGVSFRRLPALLCLYWLVYWRLGQKILLLLLLMLKLIFLTRVLLKARVGSNTHSIHETYECFQHFTCKHCLQGLAMLSITWNRFPIKNLRLIPCLFKPVEWSYLNTHMCKFESSQKDESRGQSTDSSSLQTN